MKTTSTAERVSLALAAVQQVADNKAVWRANTNGGYLCVLVALFTNQIVPYPSNPYEEYTLSNCVVFTMTLSKALRKTSGEMQEHGGPKIVTNASGKEVLCYGNWGACPYHTAHCQVPEDFLKWRSNGVSSLFKECISFIFAVSQFGDLAVLNSLFPEVLCNEKSPSDLQSSIDTLRTECLNGACRGGEKSLVMRLITLGTDVNEADMYGQSSLWWACYLGNVDIVKFLKDIPGIDVDKAGRGGQTPFCCACSHGHVDVVKILKDIPGIDVNKADNDGETPFFSACSEGHAEIVKILKDIPGDVNKADIYGRTPFQCARDSRHVEVVKILEDIPGVAENL